MFKHETVLLNEAIDMLDIQPDGCYVDATLGGGGHSRLILSHLENGKLFAFDRDVYAIRRAQEHLDNLGNVTLINENFCKMKDALYEAGILQVDGILFDLGLSSFQIDDPARGFSYMNDVPLDMRMDQANPVTAATIINTYAEAELTEIFYKYGEEKNARKIARAIVFERPLKTTFDLVRLTDRINHGQKGHSAKRVFQAIRIAVNDELRALENVLDDALALLAPKGRIVAITFHSLEDRIVKHFFKKHSEVQVPKNMPIIDLPVPRLIRITRKPITPTDEEMNANPRSRSAKLRVVERTNI